jgi:hypothetical protein
MIMIIILPILRNVNLMEVIVFCGTNIQIVTVMFMSLLVSNNCPCMKKSEDEIIVIN